MANEYVGDACDAAAGMRREIGMSARCDEVEGSIRRQRHGRSRPGPERMRLMQLLGMEPDALEDDGFVATWSGGKQ